MLTIYEFLWQRKRIRNSQKRGRIVRIIGTVHHSHGQTPHRQNQSDKTEFFKVGNAFIYWRKNEAEATFCSSIQRQIQRELGISVYGSVRSMRDIFDILFSYATQNQLNLVIDEVQEFFYVRKSIFADMQELWDKYKSDMKINFIPAKTWNIYSWM